MRLITRMLLIYVAALPMALAQSADTGDGSASSMGSERAKLANQRIQAEIEMREREEQRRLAEEQAKVRAQQAAARSEVAAAQFSKPATEPAATAVLIQSSPAAATAPAETVAPVPNSRAAAPARGNDMYRTLEQLRLLGELKDDGYVSEEEFQKIKQRILDDQT